MIVYSTYILLPSLYITEPQQPTNCVGTWSSWSTCSATCGSGQQTRTFSISVQAQNGGTPCVATNGQSGTQPCSISSCPQGASHVAHILVESCTYLVGIFSLFVSFFLLCISTHIATYQLCWIMVLLVNMFRVVRPRPANTNIYCYDTGAEWWSSVSCY